MAIKEELYGTTSSGIEINRFTVENSKGISMSVIPWGATLISLKAPDRKGNPQELTLGFDSLSDYLAPHPYFGSTVGRFCNRISSGSFTLNGKDYQLALNESGRNHLHGGVKGFDKAIWKARVNQDTVIFSYTSPDGEEGYPGTVRAEASYSLHEDRLIMEYSAETDKPTPINITNHAYWNLAGEGSGSILSHELLMYCSKYLPVDEELIPTGEIKDVEGTPLDFRKKLRLGARINDLPGGYDFCYVVDSADGSMRKVLAVFEPGSGRCMELSSTQNSVQLYTGNYLNGIAGRGAAVFNKFDGFCVEAQNYPDAVNKPDFPSSIIEPGKPYNQKSEFRFYTF